METLTIDGVLITVLPPKPPKPLTLRPHEVAILQDLRAGTHTSQHVASTHGISPQQLNTLKRKLEAAGVLPIVHKPTKRERERAYEARDAQRKAEYEAQVAASRTAPLPTTIPRPPATPDINGAAFLASLGPARTPKILTPEQQAVLDQWGPDDEDE